MMIDDFNVSALAACSEVCGVTSSGARYGSNAWAPKSRCTVFLLHCVYQCSGFVKREILFRAWKHWNLQDTSLSVSGSFRSKNCPVGSVL